MKANRKFLNGDDEAVSPVIAVILMVAITVVLAATVYVWVSGFGASGTQAKNLSVSQGTATNLAAASGSVSYTIVSISPNYLVSNFKVTSSGTGGPFLTTATAGSGVYSIAINGVNPATSTSSIAAGDIVKLQWGASTTGPTAGDTLNFIDIASGNIVSSIVVHS
jgi:flagellin-like protein